MALTDSRLRSDQRIMEEGDFDRANGEKVISLHMCIYIPYGCTCMWACV